MSKSYDMSEGERLDPFLVGNELTAEDAELVLRFAATVIDVGLPLDWVWGDLPDPDKTRAVMEAFHRKHFER